MYEMGRNIKGNNSIIHLFFQQTFLADLISEKLVR